MSLVCQIIDDSTDDVQLLMPRKMRCVVHDNAVIVSPVVSTRPSTKALHKLRLRHLCQVINNVLNAWSGHK